MWIFRVVADGDRWLCLRGTRVLGTFESFAEAVGDAERHALANRPSQVVVDNGWGVLEEVARFLVA